MQLSLVRRDVLRRDPRKLPYLYPDISARRYKELAEEYHRQLTLQAVEKVAGMFGCILIPSSCVHHSRREPSRRIVLYGRTYYVRDLEDITPLETAKMQAILGDVEDQDG